MSGRTRPGGAVRLEAHPDSAALAAGLGIDGSWSLAGRSLLALEFALTGRWSALRVPAAGAARREDGLWEHTCFEAFVGDPVSARYCEFNCSPSGAWAAYSFAGYRAGRQPLAALAQLPLATRTANGRLLIAAELDLRCLPADYGRPLAVGLAAVLEHAGGERSYWALAHPAARADFHDRRAFGVAIAG